MTTVATSASVKFGAGQLTAVDSSFRLTGRTYIDCYTYDDRPPILAVTDAHVSVSVTVPDSSQVTEEDVTCARLLAETVALYVAELERRAALERESTEGADASAGQAA
jgi:hypothetical protein